MDKVRNSTNPFNIMENRVMISLGALSSNRYCPYNCAFCYVQGAFMQYPTLSIGDIVKYLDENKEKYDIVYVSGDTDSFAPPRTEKGIDLIRKISENIDTDILFTTRAIFNDKQLSELGEINEKMLANDRKLIGCISIPRLYSAEHIEPYPIPSPADRIETLKKLKEHNLVTILAMRPFLPIINSNEYIQLIKQCEDFVDVVLGEHWYANDELIQRVFAGTDSSCVEFSEKRMDFDDNDFLWKCFEAEETEEKVRDFCNENDVKFFMRSRPAIEYIRGQDLEAQEDQLV